MNWKLFGGFGILISVIIALSLGLTLPKNNAEPDHDPETEGLRKKQFFFIWLLIIHYIILKHSATTTTQLTMTTGKLPINDELMAVNPLNFVRAETDRNMNLIRLKILSKDSKLHISYIMIFKIPFFMIFRYLLYSEYLK